MSFPAGLFKDAKKLDLIAASALSLFLELALIRWYPAHVFSIAFFSNIVLIASFFGLGAGMLSARKGRDFSGIFPLSMVGLMLFVLFFEHVQVSIPEDAKTWIWSYYTGNRMTQAFPVTVSIAQAIVLVFAATSIVFIPLGRKIGVLMQGIRPLEAYTLNVAGSLAGVAGFAAVSSFAMPAWTWFGVCFVGSFIVFRSRKMRTVNTFFAVAAVLAVYLGEAGMIWSPYYAINTRQIQTGSKAVYVNKLFHQMAVNFEKEPEIARKYLAPYTWFRPEKVLVVGAGTGNDVWAALKAGAKSVDAVEIDPAIPKLGHPQGPYDDDRVHLHVDDARSFMQRSPGSYDLIVYGTLDSHANLSANSAIRMDNYVYTVEALREAKRLAGENGTVLLLFSVAREWMATRFFKMTREVFGAQNARYVMTDNRLFNLLIAAGPRVEGVVEASPGLQKLLMPLPESGGIEVITDDWPYLYLAERGIPPLYRTALLAMLAVCLTIFLVTVPARNKGIDICFFLMGCGFLLLETKSVTTFSVLFGSTWIVNAVVFTSVLLIALAANAYVMKKNPQRITVFLVCLFLSLIFLYVFPAESLLKLSMAARVLAAGFLVAAPILFSSIIFAYLIGRTKQVGSSLGSNLLGAVLGGMTEYVSMIWGLNSLYLVAFCFYAVAAFFIVRRAK